jgi:hypothetical protein
MPIPRKGVKIELNKAEPSVLTPEKLKEQLKNIGLTCADTSLPRLKEFIQEVENGIPPGLVQTYGILQPAKNLANRVQGLAMNWEEAATGNWTIKDFGYSSELELIQYKAHFDWLAETKQNFTGRRSQDKYVRRYDSIASIKDFFADTTTSASAAVVKGVDKSSLNAAMSNAIQPLDDQKAQDYDKSDSRVLFLVDNYDKEKNEADAIGVLTVEWHLIIKDYKEKKKALQHDTTLEVNVRAVTYDNLDVLAADVRAIKAHFGGNLALSMMGIPPKDTSLIIYEKEPPESADTFQHALPVTQLSNYLDRLVLFAPDLQLIGSVDNSNSAVATTYAKSVTTGFTFSSSQTLGIKVAAEAGVVFAKASFEFSFSISFTEQYSTSSTETVSFGVPAGQKAFLYQGTLRSRILRYDPAKDSYRYQEEASFLTTIFDTLKEPIPAKKPVVLRQLSE